MLTARRCPFTQVVNFFDETDPFIAVGSVARCGTQVDSYTWRCYVVDIRSSGVAPDGETAERRLTNFYAMTQEPSDYGDGALLQA